MQPVTNSYFQAPWPDALKPTWASKISDFVFGIFHLIRWPFSRAAGALIHPAWWMHSPDPAVRAHHEKAGGKIVHYRTPDGELIEGMLFKGSSSNKKAVIYAGGNNDHLDNSAYSFPKFVKKYVGNVDVLMLNYRGVGYSTGRSTPQGLALDTYSAGQYLSKIRGISSSKILFYGHSLGGYAAVKGGALFQTMHKQAKVPVASDRSFGDLISAAKKIAGYIQAFLVWILDWQLDARKDWDTIKGRKIVIYDKQDQTLPYPISFFEAVKNRPSSKGMCAIELHTKGSEDPHCRELRQSEASRLGYAMKQALAGA